jgi:hypothetical protein
MYWFLPALGAKPQATVLVELPRELAERSLQVEESGAGSPEVPPLDRERSGAVMTTLLFGAGRVFYCGVDSTWRWRYHFGELYFGRFWGQVIRWAASERLPAGDDHVRLGTDELRYELPARVTISAIVNQSDGKPLEGARIDAVVRHEASGKVERARLQPVPQSGGLYRGTIEMGDTRENDALGEHEVTLEIPALPGYSERDDRASVVFLVEEPPSREAADLTRNRELLQEMVRRAGPGGRYLPIDRAAELPEMIPDRTVRKEEVTTIEQWVLAWPLLILVALLITAEWVLRKKFDLI